MGNRGKLSTLARVGVAVVSLILIAAISAFAFALVEGGMHLSGNSLFTLTRK